MTMHRRRGFSILELMVALVVIVTAVSLARAAFTDAMRAAASVPSAARRADDEALALLTLRAAGSPWWPGWEMAGGALARVQLPGRFQQVGRWIFDVAHNPDGAAVLAMTLSRLPREPMTAVVSIFEWSSRAIKSSA